jgi:hypothetical protein
MSENGRSNTRTVPAAIESQVRWQQPLALEGEEKSLPKQAMHDRGTNRQVPVKEESEKDQS